MPRTAITPQQITTAGLVVATEPANVDGNSFPAGSILRVTNGDTAAKTVTIPMPGTVDGITLPGRAESVAAGATEYFARHGEVYHQSDSTIHVNYSAVTAVTVAVLKP